MSLGQRLADGSYRFYDAIRSPRAKEAASGEPTARDFSALRRRKYALITTFRRSGEPMPTSVWFGLDAGGKLYFRTDATTGKVKRIRREPRVLVAPCTMRGKPLGPTAEGTARILPPEEADRAEAVVQANYGLFRRVYEKSGDSLGFDGVYLEVTPREHE